MNLPDDKPEVLPCGCKIVAVMHQGESTFAIEACSLDCEWVKYSMEEMKKKGGRTRYSSGTIGSDGKIHEDGSAA